MQTDLDVQILQTTGCPKHWHVGKDWLTFVFVDREKDFTRELLLSCSFAISALFASRNLLGDFIFFVNILLGSSGVGVVNCFNLVLLKEGSSF